MKTDVIDSVYERSLSDTQISPKSSPNPRVTERQEKLWVGVREMRRERQEE